MKMGSEGQVSNTHKGLQLFLDGKLCYIDKLGMIQKASVSELHGHNVLLGIAIA